VKRWASNGRIAVIKIKLFVKFLVQYKSIKIAWALANTVGFMLANDIDVIIEDCRE
jgi:hypothetical protein